MFDYIFIYIFPTYLFFSLFVYWILFQTWQRFLNGYHGKKVTKGIFLRSTLSALNAGVLATMPANDFFTGTIPSEKIAHPIINGFIWLTIGVIVGLIKKDSKPKVESVATD